MSFRRETEVHSPYRTVDPFTYTVACACEQPRNASNFSDIGSYPVGVGQECNYMHIPGASVHCIDRG